VVCVLLFGTGEGVQRLSDELVGMLADDLDGSFERLVLAFQDRLYGFALRLLRDPHDAEEVAQDTFVRAYRALGDYQAERIRSLALRPWLYRIALNVVRNRVRGRHLVLVPLDGADGRGAAEPVDRVQPSPDEHTLRAEQADELGAQVAALPRRYREAVVLRHVEGFGYAEIAELLGQPVGTAKANVHRGIRLLRERVPQTAR
jgi:RNA polymerase sigma-70 factor (ECF subfamily)